MKKQIIRVVSVLFFSGLLFINIDSVSALDPASTYDEIRRVDEGLQGPDWNGFKLDSSNRCCKRRYYDDQCSGAYSSC